MPQPLKRRQPMTARVPSTTQPEKKRRPGRWPWMEHALDDRAEAGTYFRRARLEAINQVRPLTAGEYELLVQPKTDDEESQASSIIWERAAELREKARQIAGVEFDPEP